MANSTKQSSKKASSNVLLFGSMNYKLMIIGALLITAGFVLMSGGGAELSGEANTAETFDSSIYSNQRACSSSNSCCSGLHRGSVCHILQSP